MTLQLALLGAGDITTGIHLRNLARRRDVDVAVVAEPDPGRRGRARSLAGGALREVEDWRAALAHPGVTAVLVALPTHLHAEAAAEALAAGKHVYLEKPLAHELEAGARVVEAWKTSGRVAALGFHLRHNELVRDLASRVAGGEVGRPAVVRAVFSTPAGSLPDWKMRRETGGGALLELASHTFDLIPFVVGAQVARVSALVGSRRWEEDTAAVQLELRNGVLAQVFVSLDACEEDRLEVLGEGGRLALHRYRDAAVRRYGARASDARRDEMRNRLRSLGAVGRRVGKLRAPGHEPAYAAALGAFVAAAAGGDPSGLATPVDGFRSLAVVEAAERSARSGAVEEVAGLPGGVTE